MRQETKDRLRKAATIAAMVTPPWNIFWWTVGGIAYAAQGGKKNDPSGDGALGMVVFAPVTLPLMPFVMLKEHIELKRYERQQAQYKDAATWIAAGLRRNGISVTVADSAMSGAKVVAKPGPQQKTAYGQVYAEAVRHFAGVGLTIEQICSDAQPLSPLDRAWAERNGFDTWAEELFTAPCADCSKRESNGWHFGKALTSIKATQARQEHTITFAGGGKRFVHGHICRPCLDKLGWKEMWTSYNGSPPNPDPR